MGAISHSNLITGQLVHVPEMIKFWPLDCQFFHEVCLSPLFNSPARVYHWSAAPQKKYCPMTNNGESGITFAVFHHLLIIGLSDI